MDPGGAVARSHHRDPRPEAVRQPVVGHVDGAEVGAAGPVVHGHRGEAADPRLGEVLDDRLSSLAQVVAVGHRHRDAAGHAYGVAGPQTRVWAPGDDGVDVLALPAPGVDGRAPGGAAVAGDSDGRPAAARLPRREEVLGHDGHDSGVEGIGRGTAPCPWPRSTQTVGTGCGWRGRWLTGTRGVRSLGGAGGPTDRGGGRGARSVRANPGSGGSGGDREQCPQSSATGRPPPGLAASPAGAERPAACSSPVVIVPSISRRGSPRPNSTFGGAGDGRDRGRGHEPAYDLVMSTPPMPARFAAPRSPTSAARSTRPRWMPSSGCCGPRRGAGRRPRARRSGGRQHLHRDRHRGP